MNNLKWLVYSIVISCILTVLAPPSFAELKMGVFPRSSASEALTAFSPLAEKLSQELGEKVQLVLAKDFQAFGQSVNNDEYDIIHYSQLHYVKSGKKLGHTLVVASEEFGKKTLTGAIFVHRDSGIESIADLKGKKILFGGGKEAMGAYIAPITILKRSGLEEGRDYTSAFAKSGPNAVRAVYHKQVDAACAGSVVLSIKSAAKEIDQSQIKMLAESEPFTQLPWVVNKGVAAEKAAKIKETMISLKMTDEGKRILEAAGVTDFFEVQDSDYDSVRDMVRDQLPQQ